MKKRQDDNRPGFPGDAYADVMRHMEERGIDNAVALSGKLKDVAEVVELCGSRFDGYQARVETQRTSGMTDEVLVVFTDADIPKEEGMAGVEIPPGSPVLVSGKIQTLKDFRSGKVKVFVLADFLAMAKNPMEQNDVMLRGVIANKPIYRETPRGKRITDIMVRVKGEIMRKPSFCFVPCVCWQEQADEVAGWHEGDEVGLAGRYQSRQYEKVVDVESGKRETRTAYEVSVRRIGRKDEARNES